MAYYTMFVVNIGQFFFSLTSQLFLLFCSASSTRNKGVFSVIADAVSNDYGGSEQCPWSPAQLRGKRMM